MTQLSAHFSLEELTATRHSGIDNTPPQAIIDAMANTLCPKAEEVRAFLNKYSPVEIPMNVLSGYRCRELNEAVGGSETSDHMNGLALDFIAPAFGDPRRIVIALGNSGIKFDQLIWEQTWVHIGVGPRMRQQILTAQFIDGQAQYSQGVA